ncbi:MAG: hypothetical protein M3Q94_13090 [Pseudomonadota bacterium]|nr:hypothetical protein [Pseudomonadota bacterium]
MEVWRNLLLLGFLLVAGCEQTPSVCEGKGITQGVIRAVNANTRDAMPLVKNLQLQSVRAVSDAVVQGVTVCSAQIVIPSEFSTLRKTIEYQVRAAMPGNENIFMSLSPDPSMKDFYTDVQTLSENVFGKSG